MEYADEWPRRLSLDASPGAGCHLLKVRCRVARNNDGGQLFYAAV